ncbi:MAG: arsenate reductase family protein [Balneolaceae bacterium]|nr:arsenate reductase family protein [Balneolaceae bacterium]
MLHVIGIPNCNKIRDTKKWLEERDIAFEFINVKKEPLTLDELKDLEFKVGLDVLVNNRGTTYRNLKIKELNPTDEEMLQLLFDNQSMIKRPVLVFEDSVLVGFDEESFETFMKEHGLIEVEE